MNNQRIKKQKGGALIIVTLAMPVLIALLGVAVDVGNVAMVYSQLQMTADAAALAAASSVSNSSQAISAAQQIANLNHPNHGTVLSSSNVLIGVWNTSTNTFTTTSSNPNAVKVTVQRTSANSNPVNLIFMPILGYSAANVTATAIAMSSYPSLSYGIVGLSSITMTGGTYIDSYNSSQGAYSSSTATHNGNIASNGNITINNGADVYGNANPGIGDSVSVAPGSTVTGSTTALTQALSYPPVSAPTSYNNHGLGTSLNLGGGSTTTLTPDTYYFTSITISNGAQLVITGNTTIYVGGAFNLSGGGIVNDTANANNLSLLFTSAGTSVSISNGTAFYGLIYAPDAAFTIQGGSGYYGALIGQSMNISNGAAIHRDTSLLSTFSKPTIKLVQ